MHVGIIGGGLMGLTAAYRLLAKNYHITILERERILGGLVGCVPIGDTWVERFYHHAFRSDTDLLALTAELGLQDSLVWSESKMAYYTQKHLHAFGTPLDLLRFRPLSLKDRLRFGWSLIFLKRQKNLSELEKLSAEEWFLKYAGRAVYETLWKPLLIQKFDRQYADISIAWLWRKIQMRGDSRSRVGLKERLGYMEGSFGRLIQALAEKIFAQGGTYLTGQDVKVIRRQGNGIRVETTKGRHFFDKVITTFAPAIFCRIVEGLPSTYLTQMHRIQYTAVLCTLLILNSPFSSFYWINIGDPEIPFGGLIEHTNFHSSAHYGGKCLLYISDYLYPDNPRYRLSDDQLFQLYQPYLAQIQPEFRRHWVERIIVSRATYAQPVIPTNYSQILPPFETPVQNLYTLSMAQIYPEDRGMNYSIRLGNQIAEWM